MTAVHQEIATIYCPDPASLIQFGHSDQASVSQIHGPVGVLGDQGEHACHLFGQVKIQDQVAPRNQSQYWPGIWKETAGLRQNNVAGEERSMLSESLDGPSVTGIIGCQQTDDDARISNGLHASCGSGV